MHRQRLPAAHPHGCMLRARRPARFSAWLPPRPSAANAKVSTAATARHAPTTPARSPPPRARAACAATARFSAWSPPRPSPRTRRCLPRQRHDMHRQRLPAAHPTGACCVRGDRHHSVRGHHRGHLPRTRRCLPRQRHDMHRQRLPAAHPTGGVLRAHGDRHHSVRGHHRGHLPRTWRVFRGDGTVCTNTTCVSAPTGACCVRRRRDPLRCDLCRILPGAWRGIPRAEHHLHR